MKEVNHKIPFDGIDDPLRLDWGNLESLCLSCHRIREHERKKAYQPMGTLYIVTGPPGSGKTTYINQHKGKDDVVFDYDLMAQAMGAPMYECPAHMVIPIEAMRSIVLNNARASEKNTWVIYTDFDKARDAARHYGGTLKIISTPAETCIERLKAENRPRLEQRIERIHQWCEQYRRHVV
jgi:hypothetical protein